MKKIASIAALAIFTLAFTSCKKKYTCECTSTTNGVANTPQSVETDKMTKKDAEAKCNEGDQEVTSGGVTIKQDCNIK